MATALCAFAPTVELLVACRLAQGLAGAAGIVIARAVARDLYDGVALARFFSTLMLISGMAPILAPLIGGQVLRFTDWRGVFVVLTVLGVLLTALVWTKLPETLAPADRHGGNVGDALAPMRRLLADRVFTGYMLAGGFAFAALFSYVAASPFVMQEIYGASPQTFSLLFGLNSIGLMIMGQVNGKILVGRVRLDKALGAGLAVVVAAATALLLMSLGVFGETGLVPVAAALFVLMSSMGVVMPNTQTLPLMRARHAAGSASALLGTTSFLIGAIASPRWSASPARTPPSRWPSSSWPPPWWRRPASWECAARGRTGRARRAGASEHPATAPGHPGTRRARRRGCGAWPRRSAPAPRDHGPGRRARWWSSDAGRSSPSRRRRAGRCATPATTSTRTRPSNCRPSSGCR